MFKRSLARNHLVWIDSQAWQQIEAHEWDAQAREILAHWRVKSLPLVVGRQRDGIKSDEICVGLPAPSQWSRRRLALSVGLENVQVSGAFPTLLQVARASRWGRTAMELGVALSSSGVDARVYGSFGWQFLTRMSYLHSESDIDLILNVTDFRAACQIVQRLEFALLPRRIDGEIVFSTGEAIAWRELQKLISGQTAQVMVKERCCVRLATIDAVRHFGSFSPTCVHEAVLELN